MLTLKDIKELLIIGGVIALFIFYTLIVYYNGYGEGLDRGWDLATYNAEVDKMIHAEKCPLYKENKKK